MSALAKDAVNAPSSVECFVGGSPVSVTVLSSFEAAQAPWRQLTAHGIATPYQCFELLHAWQAEVGVHSGVKPFIIVGTRQDGSPAFLLPMGRSIRRPLNILHFLGGKHVNFNLGLWDRQAAASISRPEVEAIVGRVAQEHGIDLVALYRQPVTWDGIGNPLAQLAPKPSEPCARLDLTPAKGDARATVLAPAIKSNHLRSKERKLAKLENYRYFVASKPAEVTRILDVFTTDKAAHLAAQGLPNVFAEPGVMEFIRTASNARLTEGRPAIEIHAIEAEGEIIAMFAGACDGRRFSCMFNTYTNGPHARQSPGLVLLVNMIANCAERGVEIFDLGVGQATYKTLFCNEPEPLVDTFVPTSALGRLAANAFGAAAGAKRLIKETPALWETVQLLRRLRAWRNESRE